ncbi:hypothetical protein SAMN04488691_11032 [Haloferax larsenii]|uniref:Uncharacterized protein n=1 Tax=Haloferax larsenii TaxID=302484 RepID=A0A1H7TST1_HALLR|nr:hypothetical protein SAMN04488691_11032 [Haloferax larsenii]
MGVELNLAYQIGGNAECEQTQLSYLGQMGLTWMSVKVVSPSLRPVNSTRNQPIGMMTRLSKSLLSFSDRDTVETMKRNTMKYKGRLVSNVK